jgi:hypothetical protein
MATTVLPSLGQVRRYAGHTLQDLPSTAVAGSECYLIDTGTTYVFDGTAWFVKKDTVYHLLQLKELFKEQQEMLANMENLMEQVVAHVD